MFVGGFFSRRTGAMRADNIKWSPVRLQSRRVDNNRHEIFRDGKLMGVVERHRGEWRSREPRPGYIGGSPRWHPSWRAAVLGLARHSSLWTSSDGPQDYGMVRMLRVRCATAWYTVIADRESRYVYPESTASLEPQGLQQTMLRRVLAAAEAHLARAPVRGTG